jgi:trigger factor
VQEATLLRIEKKKKMLQFAQADQKLLGDVTDFLIESTKFDLPAGVLEKWLQTVGEKNYLLKKLR